MGMMPSFMPRIDYTGLLWVVALSALTYLPWLLFWLRTELRWSEVLLAAYLCNVVQIIGLQVALGLIGQLYAMPLAVATFVCSGIVLWQAVRLQRRRASRIGTGEPTRWRQLRWRQLIDAGREIGHSRVSVLLLGLLGANLLWLLFLACIFPPYAYDEFYYHMPIVATIIQEHTIVPPDSAIPYIQAYPRFSELLSVWNSIFLHRDTFADLAQVPMLAMGGLALYIIARNAGAMRRWAIACAALWWFCPIVILQANTTYNDIMLGGWWACALAFALPNSSRESHAAQDRRQGRPVLVALAGGLMLGSKISGQVHVVALALLLLYLAWQQRSAWRITFKQIAGWMGMVAITGGVWHVLNAIQWGNPFYPIPIRVFGVALLPGDDYLMNSIIGGAAEQHVAHIPTLPLRVLSLWFDLGNGYEIGAPLNGFGPLWPIVALPALVLATVWAWQRRDFLVHGLLLIAAMLLILTPASWTPRYSLALVAIGALALAKLSAVFTARTQHWVAGAMGGLSILSLLLTTDHLYFDVPRIRKFTALPDAQRIATQWDPGSFGATYQWIEANTHQGHITLAYDGVTLVYPLWGYGFRNRVIYVRPNDTRPYFDDLQTAGVNYAVVNKTWPSAKALQQDARAHVAFDGPDDLIVFTIQQP